MSALQLRRLAATRYLTPLREGGSLPAIVEADDGELYVLKFVGAGQGPKALIAELIAGEIGRTLGLPVPELVLMDLDAAFGRDEPDQELQDLLRASVGLNLGMGYLPRALPFSPLLCPPPAADLASAIVWFDAYVTNVDRTASNVNMLISDDKLWLIDHGASLYFQYSWREYMARSRAPFGPIAKHVLLPFADGIAEADARLGPLLANGVIGEIVDLVPDDWLRDSQVFPEKRAQRQAYVDYLTSRLEASSAFVEEAIRAHHERV